MLRRRHDVQRQGLARPVVEYSHDDGCRSPRLRLPRRRISSVVATTSIAISVGLRAQLRYTNGAARDQRTWDVGNAGSVLSFGEDANGELYVLSANGRVYRLDPR